MCRHVPYGGPNFCKRKDRKACSSNINELAKESVYRISSMIILHLTSVLFYFPPCFNYNVQTSV